MIVRGFGLALELGAGGLIGDAGWARFCPNSSLNSEGCFFVVHRLSRKHQASPDCSSKAARIGSPNSRARAPGYVMPEDFRRRPRVGACTLIGTVVAHPVDVSLSASPR